MISVISLRAALCLSKQQVKGCRFLNKLSYIHHIGEEPLRIDTIGTLLETAANKYGDRIAIKSRHQSQSMSFAVVLEKSDRLAAAFKNLNVSKGDRVGIWSPNSIEWYISAMACMRAGLILVNINSAYQPSELEFSINKVKCKALVMASNFKSQDYYGIIESLAPEITVCDPGKLKSSRMPSLETVIVTTDQSLKGVYSFQELYDIPNENDIKKIKENQSSNQADERCCIMYTSGTTGKPKATVLSHFNIVNNGYLSQRRAELGLKQHILCLQVPFFHTFGFTFGIVGSLALGNTLVLPHSGYNPAESLMSIVEERCTVLCGTPTMNVDLVTLQKDRNLDISSLEIAVSGGAICTPHLFEEMLKVLGVQCVKSLFGMTETTAATFVNLPGETKENATTSVGYPLDHVEVKVTDEKGVIVPIGTPGEVHIRAFCNMLEYWNDEVKTKEILGSDRWLKTGDKFILEESGYGRVIGRIKDVIIRGGENIFPKEIEDFINTHPCIIDCYVIGLPHERLGEEICACVRVKQGNEIDLKALQAFCKGKMAHFKIPSVLKIVDDYPRTASGKIQKFKLVEKFTNK